MPAPDRETILVLSAGFGEGHNTAARNLAAALSRESGGKVVPVVLDPFTAAAPRLSAFMKWGYQFMTNRMPAAWGWLYETTRHGNFGNHVWDRWVGLMRWLEEKLAEVRPAKVVMTYPLYASFIPGLNAAVPRPERIYVAVTDSITIHPIWTQAPANRWFVTDYFSRDIVTAQGVPPEKCSVTGFATAADFAHAAVPETERSGVLYMATTATKHVKRTLAGLIRDLPVDVPLTIITGRHEDRLRPVIERQLRAAARRPVQIYGWTTSIPSLMARSRLVLTKAGGATVHECLAAAVPAVINYIIPGQEEGNVRLLELTGCGCRSEEPENTGALLRELFTGDGLARMTASMKIQRRPDGAARMARQILEGT
ncbi:MAG TPA: glycosyltransferase [Verrucomicrobiales bacterium]|nr:glycosyltransferase [Verrucomicrobiales bacterium]